MGNRARGSVAKFTPAVCRDLRRQVEQEETHEVFGNGDRAAAGVGFPGEIIRLLYQQKLARLQPGLDAHCIGVNPAKLEGRIGVAALAALNALSFSTKNTRSPATSMPDLADCSGMSCFHTIWPVMELVAPKIPRA